MSVLVNKYAVRCDDGVSGSTTVDLLLLLMKASQRNRSLGTPSVPGLPALGAEGLCNVTGLGEWPVELTS